MKDCFTIRGGQVVERQALWRAIQFYISGASAGLHQIELKRISDRRTARQNRYLWKLCEMLAEEIGYGTDDRAKDLVLSDAMEDLGMGVHVNFRGRVKFVRDSTALKDRDKFGRILEKLHEIGAFLNDGRESERHLILPSIESGLLD